MFKVLGRSSTARIWHVAARLYVDGSSFKRIYEDRRLVYVLTDDVCTSTYEAMVALAYLYDNGVCPCLLIWDGGI